MRTYTLRCELVARVPIRDAFAVFEDPYNLKKITPPWLHFQITTPARVRMQRGAEIDYEFRWLGVPLRWKTVITEYEPPHAFVDEALRSPYLFWKHRHTFRETPEGTIVADQVDYALPFGVLGAAVHEAVVARQLRRIFEFRQRAIAGLIGGAITRMQDPIITTGSA